MMAFWLGILTILGEIFMPELMVVLAPGFAENHSKFALAVSLSRITVSLPCPDLSCRSCLRRPERPGEVHRSVGVVRAVQHRLDRLHALDDPLCPDGRTCVVVGGHDFRGHATRPADDGGPSRRDGAQDPRPRMTPQMRLLMRRMAPGLLGAGVTQLNLTVDVIIASLLPPGTVSVLYFAGPSSAVALRCDRYRCGNGLYCRCSPGR